MLLFLAPRATRVWRALAGAFACVLVLPGVSRGQPAFEMLAAFELRGSHGMYPYAPLLEGADGSLYGSTESGGIYGSGSIFKLDRSGPLTTLHSFGGLDGTSPWAGLIRSNDGNLYGTTTYGTFANGSGTIFKVDQAGTLTTVLVFHGSQREGASSRAPLLQGSDGSLYGTALFGGTLGWGTVFKVNAAGVLTVLHTFSGSDGGYPYAGLIETPDGNLYGTTSRGGAFRFGTVFRLDSAGTLTTLHSFDSSDGAYPVAGLIQAADGSFYGTTYSGGISNHGTIFKLDTAGTLTTLHEFGGANGASPTGTLIEAADGTLYGTTLRGGSLDYGTVFKITTSGTFTTLHSFAGTEGAIPFAGLIQGSAGAFYGTTVRGGAGGLGTIFEMDAAGTITTRHHFVHGSGGVQPSSGLLQGIDGSFYGTTIEGGSVNAGTIFKLDLAGTLTVLHSFNGTDGAAPYMETLVQESDGSLYGTAARGGAFGFGTVFELNTAGRLTTLHSFDGVDGDLPAAGLVRAHDGSFYGTTLYGGQFGHGTVFKITPAGALTTVHSFNIVDGRFPLSTLTQAADGSFYGTTAYGGSSTCALGWGCGTIYKLDASGRLTTLHRFNDNDGAWPHARMTLGRDGSFYGTTSGGGGAGWGTVFRLSASGVLTTLHSFDLYTDAAHPRGPLLEGSDGSLYGTTLIGREATYNSGIVFKLDAMGRLTVLHQFTGSDGESPTGSLIQAIDGHLYGTTAGGGPGLGGVVFRLRMD